MHLKADPEYDVPQEALEEADEKAEEYYHNLRKIIQTEGIDIESLGSDVPNPIASTILSFRP